ncbi:MULTISPECIES: hypothetical protein [Vibrio]|uniref:Uncharacterized protein n=2 Tax=Vibrio TaxID=662 RepID=A0A7U6FUF0_VIBAN|nr:MULTISPECIES: hypothetical protein [Vibrio]AZS27498.1 hypothetical protein DYL72_21540 [Vibrio anguillarum]AZS27517.1 hypothetical protein DYL72_21640 [Vibrio anguillarum]AZS27538.1 hypothetical protein DYL72_21755 [Vibrio anguillarum]AZS27553.1 hypothetical protein DYL72_21840 [Vibrio anguillarum]OEE73430.1 hypothetical protein A147_01025 [Vibrio splendidus FF-6]
MKDNELRLRSLVKRVKGMAALGCDGSPTEMDNESLQQVMQVMLESACEIEQILESSELSSKQERPKAIRLA